jgi:hypothetical protein
LVKLLVVFASTVIFGSILLEIHEWDIDSLLDMYVFQNWAYSLIQEGSASLYWHHISYTVVSAQVYQHWEACGSVVVRHCATNWKVAGSIPDEVIF